MPVTLENIAFQSLSLAVLGAFCRMIYRFRPQTVECFKSVVVWSSSEGFGGHEGSGGIGNKRLYDRFLGTAMTLGALSTGVAAVKVAGAALAAGTGTPGTWQWTLAGLTGTAGVAGIPDWVAPVAAVAVASVVVAIVLTEAGMLKIIGSVTLSAKFTNTIVQAKRGYLAAVSMLTVPLATVWTGVNPVRDTVVAYIAIILTITLSALFAAHTLKGFLRQKVSVLVWFLYLCTVEIFPVCAVVLAATKSV